MQVLRNYQWIFFKKFIWRQVHLLASEPVLHVDTHETPDEVLGLLADVVPVWRVKLKFSWKYETLEISSKHLQAKWVTESFKFDTSISSKSFRSSY